MTNFSFQGLESWDVWKKDFDKAAADASSPWLPPPPVPDTEASETRGVVENTLLERDKRYGGFQNNAGIAQDIKHALRCTDKWEALDFDQREALEMIASKIGRMLSGDPNYVDNWHDIAGYATLIEQRLNKRSK